MREILFRGKAIDGNWYYGVPLVFTENYVCMTAPHTCNKKVEMNTIGQYTGLTDKNGTKIFEGDIITAEIYERECEDEYLSNTPIQVTYCSGYFYPFHLEGCWRSGVSNITVIGNIHDNPELLKEREG